MANAGNVRIRRRMGRLKSLGPVRRLLLQARGRRDGKTGQFKQSPEGDWSSAFQLEEIGAYRAFVARAWDECDRRLARLRKAAGSLEGRITLLDSDSKRCADKLASVDLSPRVPGEMEAPPELLRQRRMNQNRETAIALTNNLNERNALYLQLVEAWEAIKSAEQATEERCAYAYEVFQQRNAVYLGGVVATHPDAGSIPPAALPVTPGGRVIYQSMRLEDNQRMEAYVSILLVPQIENEYGRRDKNEED